MNSSSNFPLRSSASRLKDLGFKIAFITAFSAIIYLFVTDNPRGCGDIPGHYRYFPVAGGLIVLLALIWSGIDRQRYTYQRLRYFLYTVLRCYLSYSLMLFAAAKLFDVQFYPYLYTMDYRPADTNNGWLLWIFFGRSFAYSFFVGLGQLTATFLLLFRKTATLGALLMTGILANIVFLNFDFNICERLPSCVFLAMTLYLLIDDAPRLIKAFITGQAVEKRNYPEMFPSRALRRIWIGAWLLLSVLSIVIPSYRTYKAKGEYGIGVLNDIYGAWAVDSLHHSLEPVNRVLQTDSSGWKKMFFDTEGLAFARSWRKGMENFSYKVDPSQHSVLMKGVSPDSSLTINAQYRKAGDTLILNGVYGKDSLFVRMHLMRKYAMRGL